MPADAAADLADQPPVADWLRDDAGLTGAKKGCNEGACGTCTVLRRRAPDERVPDACVVQCAGRAVTTVEGLAALAASCTRSSAAFAEHDAFQCGYCTPGQLLFRGRPASPRDTRHGRRHIREWMSGNICRCSAYPQITAAVLARALHEQGAHEQGAPGRGRRWGFRLRPAGTAESAVGTLGDAGTSVIAGGTELLNWFRLGIAAADRVVDIGGLDELRGIDRDGDELRIGALATLTEIGEHPLVTELAGALASACLQAASAQVRNRATIGGNVLQRTRCTYFRAEEPLPWPCNKRDPGSGCTSLAGLHERQAIFGWTPDCVAVQPSDPAVALAALDARAEVLGPAGPRTIPMREFHLTQREAAARGEPMRENRLGPDELITGYRLPGQHRRASLHQGPGTGVV